MLLNRGGIEPKLTSVLIRALKKFSDENKGQVNLDSASARLVLAKMLVSDEIRDAYTKDSSDRATGKLKEGAATGKFWGMDK